MECNWCSGRAGVCKPRLVSSGHKKNLSMTMSARIRLNFTPLHLLVHVMPAQVRNLLRQQELDCLLPEDCLDETTAELDVFARLVYDRLGRNYNSALLLLTKHSWIEDKVVSTNVHSTGLPLRFVDNPRGSTMFVIQRV